MAITKAMPFSCSAGHGGFWRLIVLFFMAQVQTTSNAFVVPSPLLILLAPVLEFKQALIDLFSQPLNGSAVML